MAPAGLLESFLGAIQASLSVLLVIAYGAIAAHFKLLDPKSTKAISKVCVRMFLPALLITKVGSELHAGSAGRYGIILLWALVCHLVSFLFGILAHVFLGMPDWTTVAVMFNNTTSYPLLLVAALDETGILGQLVVGDESTKDAIERAKSYFLVFSTVSSCLTFAVGPRLIDTEHAPEADDDGKEGAPDQEAPGQEDACDNNEATEQSSLLPTDDGTPQPAIKFTDPFNQGNGFFPSIRKAATQPQKLPIVRRATLVSKQRWGGLGLRTKWWLLFVSDFFNAPLIGALIGAVVGLSPALHRAFFADTQDGGIFTAWLTASLKNVGGLFVPLPVVVAGVSLYSSYRRAHSNSRSGGGSSDGGNGGEGAGGGQAKLPKATTAFILLIRFVVWPAISISVIYLLASRTDLLGSDPMLWFTLMLMPTGPPAMKLIALVQISDAGEDSDEDSIAKLLTISYVISPILSFAVVGSLVASSHAR